MNIKAYMSLNLVLFSFTCFAQKQQCATPDESLVDLNSITKCAVEKWEDSNSKNKKGTKQLAIRLTSSRKKLISRSRVVRKKVASSLTGIKSNNVNAVSASKTSDVANIVFKKTEIDNSVVLPFAMVDTKPTFEDCRNNNTKKCFDKEIAKHIRKHFSYPDEAYEKGIEGKVIVRFKIDKDGRVSDIKGSADYEKEVLKLEAERIVSELPNFTPAKHTNKLVNVNYGIPIVFKMNDGSKVIKKEKSISNAISFDEIQEVPTFESCESVAKEEKAKCFNNEMVKHIQSNFSYPKLAVEKNITGKVWINFVIDTKGEVKNIKLRGNSYILKTEAKRIISLLPKLNSGKHNGIDVNTKYVLPINFELNND